MAGLKFCPFYKTNGFQSILMILSSYSWSWTLARYARIHLAGEKSGLLGGEREDENLGK